MSRFHGNLHFQKAPECCVAGNPRTFLAAPTQAPGALAVFEVPQPIPPKSGREQVEPRYSLPIKTFAATFQGPSLSLCNILAGSLQYGTLEHCQAPVFSFGWTAVGKGEGALPSRKQAPVGSKLGWNREAGWAGRRIRAIPWQTTGGSDGWTGCGPEEPKERTCKPKLKALRSPDKCTN